MIASDRRGSGVVIALLLGLPFSSSSIAAVLPHNTAYNGAFRLLRNRMDVPLGNKFCLAPEVVLPGKYYLRPDVYVLSTRPL